MGELAGWSYWKVISITGQSGAGTDYQVELEIGDSAGGDFHLEGHCTNFPQDIRITDDDGTTLLDYWVKDITADPIIIHVEVKDDLGSNRDIRVYYGKSGETTVSNIDSTMIFGDEFNSYDSGKWSGTYTSVGSGIIELNDGEVLTSINNYGINTELIAKWSCVVDTTGDSVEVGYGIDSDAYHAVNQQYGVDNTWYTRNKNNDAGVVTDRGSLSDNTYYRFVISRNSTTSAKYSNGINDYEISTSIPTGTIPIKLFTRSGHTEKLQVDYLFVKKYNSPEPAFNSAGAEQTPTDAAPTSVFYGPLVGPFGGPI